MKKWIASLLVLALVFSPYSLNLGFLKGIGSADVKANETEMIESSIYKDGFFEYVPYEILLIERLDQQISRIE
ncbi:hypothetical protein ACERII_25590 [Evansella sp. AB-rgal1]|uniref:hypothetical protein n=1 Tax=Evansella sp. AB-rgal1 TaxID=3242696 RepID=UPI00359D6C01